MTKFLLSATEIAFVGNPLNRDDRLRQDPAIFERFKTDASARSILISGDRMLSDPEGKILWMFEDEVAPLRLEEQIFLGLNGEAPRFASLIDEAQGMKMAESMPEGYKFRDGRSLAMKLGPGHGDLGIFAQAKSLLDWHARHRFCANCGHETIATKAGYQRDCPACGANHFPRTDPVVIMLPVFEDKILIGRGPKLPPGVFSALAGFVEPGESLEEAVARELGEEAGVRINKARYWASQPWPWPCSLMMGCFAEASSLDVQPDGEEIDALLWVTRGEMTEILEGRNPEVTVPPSIAIARNLIDHWMASPALF